MKLYLLQSHRWVCNFARVLLGSLYKPTYSSLERVLGFWEKSFSSKFWIALKLSANRYTEEKSSFFPYCFLETVIKLWEKKLDIEDLYQKQRWCTPFEGLIILHPSRLFSSSSSLKITLFIFYLFDFNFFII